MAVIGNSSTQQSFTPAVDYFSGNASTTAFTLSRPVASVAQVQVVVNNVAQNPSSAYTVSSNTITFTSAPSSGTNNIYVYYTSPITQVIAPGQGTVTTNSLTSGLTITTPTINQITSAASTNLTLQSAGTTAITVDTSQNVAIGTTSPQSKLMVQSTGTFTAAGTTSNAGLHLTSSTTTGGLAGQSIVWSNYGTSGSAVQAYISACTYGSNFMAFSGSGSSEAMRIDSVGAVYFRTTGSIQTWDATTGTYAKVGDSTYPIGTTAPGLNLILNRNTSTGQIQEFKYNATAVGNISVTGSTTAYNTSSDYRLKEDIAPMTGALNKVAQLKPVTYKWKVDGSDGEGFIAHELAEVCPQAVEGTKDAVDDDGKPMHQSIDTSFLVATLTAAIQELSAKNDALTARIEALENK